jgi:hypothetical protein
MTCSLVEAFEAYLDYRKARVSNGRVCTFVVLFPDIARAGPARDQTLIFSRQLAHQLITF